MAISDQTKERLFQAIIALIVALTVYIQSKQTQQAVKENAVSTVSEINQTPPAVVAESLAEKQADVSQAVQAAEAKP